jgi:hypothetical protein
MLSSSAFEEVREGSRHWPGIQMHHVFRPSGEWPSSCMCQGLPDWDHELW